MNCWYCCYFSYLVVSFERSTISVRPYSQCEHKQNDRKQKRRKTRDRMAANGREREIHTSNHTHIYMPHRLAYSHLRLSFLLIRYVAIRYKHDYNVISVHTDLSLPFCFVCKSIFQFEILLSHRFDLCASVCMCVRAIHCYSHTVYIYIKLTVCFKSVAELCVFLHSFSSVVFFSFFYLVHMSVVISKRHIMRGYCASLFFCFPNS